LRTFSEERRILKKAVSRTLLSPEHTLKSITLSRVYSPEPLSLQKLHSRANFSPEHYSLQNILSRTSKRAGAGSWRLGAGQSTGVSSPQPFLEVLRSHFLRYSLGIGKISTRRGKLAAAISGNAL